MSSPKRFYQPNSYYHVYNRGNRKQLIFQTESDYQRFLDKVEIYQKETNVQIICFCLMPNHFHLLIKQSSNSDSLKQFMHRLCTSYSKYFNIKYDQVGSLFQGPFKAKIIENDTYLTYLSSYIHLNPNFSKISDILSYRWSSLREYLNSSVNNISHPQIVFSFFGTDSVNKYLDFIQVQFQGKETLVNSIQPEGSIPIG